MPWRRSSSSRSPIPNAGAIHLNDGRDAFGRAEPQNGNLGERGQRIAVECHNPESMAGQREATDLAGAGVQHVKQYAFARLDAQRLTSPNILPLMLNSS